jgi:hypothetical protein
MDKKTPGALLKLDIGREKLIVERRRDPAVRRGPMKHLSLTFFFLILPLAGDSARRSV